MERGGRLARLLTWFRHMVDKAAGIGARERKGEETLGQRFLIVGLGNPGRQYRKNRHNVGFMVVDRLAEEHNIALTSVQHQAVVGSGVIAGRHVRLAKPQTYMNLSGESVGRLARFYKIDNRQLLVVYDELDLPMGSIRLREKGGAGGHNGVRSLIRAVGQEFPRLRVGIGRPPGRMDPATFVLSDFKQDELPAVDEMVELAVRAIESFAAEGIEAAMTRHNRVEPPAGGD